MSNSKSREVLDTRLPTILYSTKRLAQLRRVAQVSQRSLGAVVRDTLANMLDESKEAA